MSGVPRGIGFGGNNKQEPLPKRDFSKVEDQTLPTRNEIRVIASINSSMDPLARVTKKFQVAGQPTLSLEISDYIANIELEGIIDTNLEKQALQTFLHEMMHMALWDDVSITHSTDKKSILYYYVDGSNLQYIEWDINEMREASKRIGHINIEKRNTNSIFLTKAVEQWNEWLGRDFYVLL